jgi:hypothetical protein
MGSATSALEIGQRNSSSTTSAAHTSDAGTDAAYDLEDGDGEHDARPVPPPDVRVHSEFPSI